MKLKPNEPISHMDRINADAEKWDKFLHDNPHEVIPMLAVLLAANGVQCDEEVS